MRLISSRARLLRAVFLALAGAALASGFGSAAAAPPLLEGIHKIQHVVIIMQENRSFDSYFGTYPGADGIPGLAGNPGPVPCLPDPARGGCAAPYNDTSLVN